MTCHRVLSTRQNIKEATDLPQGCSPLHTDCLTQQGRQCCWTAELKSQATSSPGLIEQCPPAGSHLLLSVQLCVSTRCLWAPGQPCHSTRLLHNHPCTSFLQLALHLARHYSLFAVGKLKWQKVWDEIGDLILPHCSVCSAGPCSSPTWFPVCCKERTVMQDCSTAGVNWRGLLQNILQWGFPTALPAPRPCQCTEGFVNLLFQEEFAIIRNTWTEKKNLFCLLEITVMS